MRVLILTQLFPNSLEPGFAAFNRQQFVALSKLTSVEILAAVPWLPAARFLKHVSRAGKVADLPDCETIFGIDVRHPLYFTVPKLPRLAPTTYAESLWPQIKQYRGQCDVLLASWAFPDGAAAITLGKRLGVPVAIKIHGSDVNTLPSIPSIHRALSAALPAADRIIAVSHPLREKAISFGVDPARCVLVKNGVDSSVFHPRSRSEVRDELGVGQDARLITFVGTLMKEKGVFDLLEAFESLAKEDPKLSLALIGQGPARSDLEAIATRHAGRVRVLGQLPLENVAQWIAAADVFTLPSWAEGTPNVVLEALASGRPVVATDVGGIPDVVTNPTLGRLVAPRDPRALSQALERTLAEDHDEQAISAAASFSWEDSAQALLEELEELAMPQT